MSLKNSHCKLDRDLKKLNLKETQEYANEISNWDLNTIEPIALRKTYTLKSFKAAMEFTNKIAQLSETENHHPDILIEYKKVTITLTTHAVNGLSENDFILAAKIDELKNNNP